MTTPPTETLPGSQISAAPEMTAAAALNDYAERIPRSRIILSSMIGTTIEFYDFYVYATAAALVSFWHDRRAPLILIGAGTGGGARGTPSGTSSASARRIKHDGRAGGRRVD